jgi:uncharacterized protein YqgV (UPF0045/DUF77 family)
MKISVQISLYPLGKKHLENDILNFIAFLKEKGLPCEAGKMSTIVSGDSNIIFSALHEAFECVASKGEYVMTLTISNACPSSLPKHPVS